ncbi:MAG: P-loop NTPase fold protein, partial [Candidatus Sulfotelmatobacter sp.]
MIKGRPRPPEEADTPLLEPDLPVPEGGEDLLGRRELIESVVSTILLEPPPIVALTGRYGDGKTSFLNLAIAELGRSQEIEVPIIVRFSPWLAGDSNALVLSLLTSIVAAIREKLFVPGLSGDAVRYARTLLSAVPWTERLKDFIGEPSQEGRIDALVDRIGRVRRRVLVVLDDLDRMEAKELETVLKLLRGSDKLSNITFLCAFDRDEVSQILKGTRPNQDTVVFIEKFFPVEFRLPEIDSAQLRSFFSQRVDRVLERAGLPKQDLTKEAEAAWDGGLDQHFLNLRKIK